jgi:hypothetical protein
MALARSNSEWLSALRTPYPPSGVQRPELDHRLQCSVAALYIPRWCGQSGQTLFETGNQDGQPRLLVSADLGEQEIWLLGVPTELMVYSLVCLVSCVWICHQHGRSCCPFLCKLKNHEVSESELDIVEFSRDVLDVSLMLSNDCNCSLKLG